MQEGNERILCNKWQVYNVLLAPEIVRKVNITLDEWRNDVIIKKYFMFNVILHLITGMSLKTTWIVFQHLQNDLMQSMSFTFHKIIYAKQRM